MSNYTTITVPYMIDTAELWRRIWGSEPQAAGSHYRAIRYLDGADWDKVGTAVVHLEDPDDEDKIVRGNVTSELIALALSDLSFPDHLRQHILDDNADCIDSDAVIQHIVYGEIVFG